MAGLNDNLHRFVVCVFVVILVSNSSVSFGIYFKFCSYLFKLFSYIFNFILGYFISAAAPSMNAALAIAGPILVPL